MRVERTNESPFLRSWLYVIESKIDTPTPGMVLRFSQSKISAMKTMTFEGIVENGQIKLPETVHLPDHTKVLVVVPDMKVEPFTIATGDDGLPVIRTTNGTITSQLVKDIETLTA